MPAFADDHPIIVFDGECIVCSGWVNFRHDTKGRYRFITAQSPLGEALYGSLAARWRGCFATSRG